MALNDEREAFLQWGHALELMPRHVRVCLNNKTGDGQIKGFDELFVYLARTEASDELREKVLEFFIRTPVLQQHLKPRRSCFLQCRPFSSELACLPAQRVIYVRTGHSVYLKQ